MDLDYVLEVAQVTAHAAGDLLMDGFGRDKEIQTKSSAVDWVTQYDLAAEAFILERLRTAFPDHSFIGEEGTDEAGAQPYTWYIDPLDGTSNYSHGFPVFCVSLALYEGLRPLLGVIYDPTRDECFTAVTGRGAALIARDGIKPMRVSGAETLVNSLLATGFPYDAHTSSLDNAAHVAHFIKQAHGLRRAGSAALDMAYVAAGRLDGYWEFKINAWDVAAGILMVREAGGVVTLMDGNPLGFERRMNIVASNGRIHDDMLAIIRRAAAVAAADLSD